MTTENTQTPPVAILPIRFTAILDAPNAAHLIRSYAAACIVPDAEPQRPLYDAMEKAGIIHCFGAYSLVGDAGPVLIGFSSVICSIMPHDGHLVASLESLFVDPPHRSTGASDMLLSAAEKFAADAGCRCFVCQARTGSAYDTVLSRRTGFSQTHSQYTKWLNGYVGGKA
jgi:GNAT superfamily N-acetyltransferase